MNIKKGRRYLVSRVYVEGSPVDASFTVLANGIKVFNELVYGTEYSDHKLGVNWYKEDVIREVPATMVNK